MWLLWEQFSVSTLFAQTCLSKQCGSSGSSSQCLHCSLRPVCPNNVAPLGAVLGVYIVCPDLSVLMWLLWEQFSVSTLFAQTCLSKQCGSSGSSSQCLHCLPRPVCPNNVAPLGAVLGVYIVCPDLSVQTMWLLWEQFSVSTLFAQTCLSKQCGSSGSSSRCLHCLPRPVCPNNVAPLGAVLGVYIVCPDLSVQTMWLLWEQFSVSTLFAQTCLSKNLASLRYTICLFFYQLMIWEFVLGKRNQWIVTAKNKLELVEFSE